MKVTTMQVRGFVGSTSVNLEFTVDPSQLAKLAEVYLKAFLKSLETKPGKE